MSQMPGIKLESTSSHAVRRFSAMFFNEAIIDTVFLSLCSMVITYKYGKLTMQAHEIFDCLTKFLQNSMPIDLQNSHVQTRRYVHFPLLNFVLDRVQSS